MRDHGVSILSICLELAGLALLAFVITLIAAFHVFDGFAMIDPARAVIFSLVATSLSLLALILFAVMRLAQLKQQNQALYRAATVDGLTRLLNRATFQQRANEMMASIGRRRTDPQSLTLLIVDADHFKKINDRLGHATGDKALVAIARMLTGCVRQEDLVGRLGGEEFVVLLRDAGLAEGEIVAERVRANVNRLQVSSAAGSTRLAVSIGGFAFDRPIPFALAYKEADANLYKAKKAGRNRSQITRLRDAIRAAGSTRQLTRTVNAPAQRTGARPERRPAPSQRPVEPNPPAPRGVASSASTST